MFHFEISDEERMIQETTRRFAQDRLLHGVRAHERARGLAAATVGEFAALGLAGVTSERTLGTFAKALILEELAAVDPGAALALDGLVLVGPLLIASGVELGSAVSRAGARGVLVHDTERRFRAEGGVVAGAHPWVPADRADVVVILQGDRALVVTSGFDLVPIDACGLGAAGASRLCVTSAPVVATIEEPSTLVRARAQVHTRVAALLTGAARGAYEYAVRYARERTAFGCPIAHHQALAFLIADMATGVDVARAMTWASAVTIDEGNDAAWASAAAFAEAAEQGLFVGPNAVQILGGHGYMKDHLVEKWMRDIRTLAQCAGGRDEAEIASAALVVDHDLGFR